MSTPQKIDDKILWKSFKENFENISYINYPHNNEIKHFKGSNKPVSTMEKIKQIDNIDFNEKIEEILLLWEMLLKDSLLFLKHKDKREHVNDEETFGVENLKDYFNEFKDFEEILYGGIDYYRDHTLHPFRVYLLGEYILKSDIYNDIDINRIRISDENNLKNEKITNEEKEAMWCIISLTHDLGYPLEKIEKINKKVRSMMEKFGKIAIQDFSIRFPRQGQAINDFILKFISSQLSALTDKSGNIDYRIHLQSKYWLKFSRAFEEYDHGLVSCVLLMKYLVYFLESDYIFDLNKSLEEDDSKQFIIRREILRSIASHNCEDIYHLTANNFSLLLILCDEMQVWQRRSREDTKGWGTEIIDLSNKNINIRIIVKKSEKEAEDIFKIKCKKFIKIFRSAVHGDIRLNEGFDFVFELENKKKNSIYKFQHFKPSNINKKSGENFYRVHMSRNGEEIYFS